MNRRSFLALTSAGVLSSSQLLAFKPVVDKIGIQFFSLPKMLEKDLKGTLAMLAKMGYREVELYGPYEFSAESAKSGWAAVTPSLGFSASGFYGHSASDMKSLLSANGLSAPSMHTDLETLRHHMPKLAEAANTIGAQYVVLPAIPGPERKTLDDYSRLADDFNKIGAEAKKYGVKYAYHNHGYGIKEVNGVMPLSKILDGTDPKLVFFELDLYWTTAGGADPIALLEKYKGRYHLMHVKDMSKKVTFSGDGGDSNQWIELFPFMTTAGSGVLDLKNILTKAKASGMKHFIVEQDMVANPEVALKKSCDFLKTV